MRRIREAGIVALGVACLGCGPRLNPEWLPEARDLSRWPYGAAVEIRLDERGAEPVRGELIAVGAETLFVLTPAGLRGVRRDHMKSVATQADREGTAGSAHHRARTVAQERPGEALPGDPDRQQ